MYINTKVNCKKIKCKNNLFGKCIAKEIHLTISHEDRLDTGYDILECEEEENRK